MLSIDYSDLLSSKDCSDVIENALSIKGVGALLITNLPQKYIDMRRRLLMLSRRFAELPEEVKNKYVHEESKYSFGWSCGKEKMKVDEDADVCKGSYYANPICDKLTNDNKLIQKHPSFYYQNIWPTEDLPEYEIAFKDLGKFMYNLGLELIKNCDSYLSNKIKNYPSNNLYSKITREKVAKARLLHYEPAKNLTESLEDGLCSWHLDHGCLTMLTSAIFLDENKVETIKPNDCGLLIKDQGGNTVYGNIPSNALLCQAGETLQILSGGHIVANQHAVKSHINNNISRETFPVFIDCSPYESIKPPNYGIDEKEVLYTRYLPKGAPKLSERVDGCEYYHEFVTKTLSAYYD